MNPFATYAEKARVIASRHPVPLVGPIKTRRAAMVRYSEIVDELHACGDRDGLECYLAVIRADLTQFQAELDFLWKGDGDDFPGLSGEIEQAFARVDEQQFHPGDEYQADGGEAGR